MIGWLCTVHSTLCSVFILMLASGLNLAMPLAANAQDVTEAGCTQIRSVDRAYFEGDRNTLTQLLDESHNIKSVDAAYIQALAHYRLAILAGQDRTEVSRQVNPAIDLLVGKLAETRTGLADERALLSAVYGLKIASNFLSAIRLGPKSSAAAAAALEEAPDNPRVLLLDGVRLFSTPARFGGDRALAMRRFQAAIIYFEDPADTSCWGLGDAYYWSARAFLANGNVEAGVEQIEKLDTLYAGSPFVGNLTSLAKDAG